MIFLGKKNQNNNLFFEQQNNTLYIGKYNIIVFLWGRINGLEFKRENLLSNQILKWN